VVLSRRMFSEIILRRSFSILSAAACIELRLGFHGLRPDSIGSNIRGLF
jgi:hypothetical protein